MSLDIAEATGIAIIAIILIAVLGNLMTLFVISRYPPLRDVTGMFLANLAVADLLQAIIGMPLIATSAFRKVWVFGDTLCTISGTTNSLFCITSVLTLTAVSIDRYLAIVHPLHYQDWLTVNRAKFALVYIWVQALFAAILPVFGWSRYVYLPYEFICTVQWEYDRSFTIAVWSSCFLAPVLVTVVCYSSIGRVAFKHAQGRETTLIGSFVERQQNPDIGTEKVHDRKNSMLGKENPVFTEECKDIVDEPAARMPKLAAAKYVENKGNPTLDDACQTQDTHSCKLVGVAFDPSKWVGTSSRENPAVVLSFPDKPTGNNNFTSSCKEAVASFSRPPEGITLAFSREAQRASFVSLAKSRVGPHVPPAILDVSIATSNAGEMGCKTSPGREEKSSPKGRSKLQSYLTRVRESIAERRALERRNRRKEMRMAFILLIVNGSFVLCWLPHFVGSLCLTFTDGSCPFPDSFFIITTTLAMLNSGCNPFIYTLTYKKFRIAFTRVMPFFRSKS